jgi:hypothetical protein
MTIEQPPKPNGCAYFLAYLMIYGLIAMGFYKVLELLFL